MPFHQIPPLIELLKTKILKINAERKTNKKSAGVGHADSFKIQIPYCSIAPVRVSRSGGHLPPEHDCPSGVAVASQVLCTSTTLNKRTLHMKLERSAELLNALRSACCIMIAPLLLSVNYYFTFFQQYVYSYIRSLIILFIV